MSITNALILGVGNALFSDRGAGVHMLAWMQRHHPELTEIDYLDGGMLSYTLAPRIEVADNLIVIGAAELQAAAGTVRVFENNELEDIAGRTGYGTYESGLADLLAVVRSNGSMPVNRASIVIQPQNVDWGRNLSNPVKQALPDIATRVLSLLAAWEHSLPGNISPVAGMCAHSG